MAKVATVEVDDKGRIHIPADVRRELKASRFKLSIEKGRIMMEPVKHPETVTGKYRGLVRVSLESLEEAQDRLVTRRKR